MWTLFWVESIKTNNKSSAARSVTLESRHQTSEAEKGKHPNRADNITTNSMNKDWRADTVPIILHYLPICQRLNYAQALNTLHPHCSRCFARSKRNFGASFPFQRRETGNIESHNGTREQINVRRNDIARKMFSLQYLLIKWISDPLINGTWKMDSIESILVKRNRSIAP